MDDDYGLRFDFYVDCERWRITDESLGAALDAIRPLVQREGGIVVAKPGVCAVCDDEYPHWIEFHRINKHIGTMFAIHDQRVIGALYGLCKDCAVKLQRGGEGNALIVGSVLDWLMNGMHRGCKEPVDVIELHEGVFRRVAFSSSH